MRPVTPVAQNNSGSARWAQIRNAIQPAIIRAYKVTGIAALGFILVGLIMFLATNIFYFFDHTWVRPVILSPGHQKVIEASAELAAAKARRSELDAERSDSNDELAQLDRMVGANRAFEAELGGVLDRPATEQTALIRREVRKSILEREAGIERKAALERRVSELGSRIAEQDVVIARISNSAYIRATTQRKVVAFVPYQNLRNAKPGTALYGCIWGLVVCTKVGRILGAMEGEVQEQHPHNESQQRGVLLEIELTKPRAAENSVLFVGGRPFWIL